MDPVSLPNAAAVVLLRDAAQRDLTTARRAVLVGILLHERGLSREQLMRRVAGHLGVDCFGKSAWEDTFYRDMRVVKAAFQAAGWELAYRRSAGEVGYYLRGLPDLSGALADAIRQAAGQVDPADLRPYHERTPAGRFQMGCSATDSARLAAAIQVQRQHPNLSPAEAARQAQEMEEQEDR